MAQEITGWALDMSNYSGAITPEWAARRLAEGWNHGIVSTQNAAIAQDQIDDMRAAGMTTDAYVFMYANDHGSPLEQVDRAVFNLGGRPIERLWLDFEGYPDSPPPEYRNRWDLVDVPQFVANAVQSCAGKVPGYDIYTSRAWWVRFMGLGNDTYRAYRLWLATADGNPNLAFEPFGGWDRLSLEQYAFDKNTDGINCDWNVMGQQFPPAPDPISLPDPVNTNTYRREAVGVVRAGVNELLDQLEEGWRA